MWRRVPAPAMCCALAAAMACGPATRSPSTAPNPAPAVGIASSLEPDVSPGARRVHRDALVVDTHIDTPQRLLFESTFELGARDPRGHLDIPRMRQGGLDAAFFSIWVPSSITGPAAVRRALSLIDETHQAIRTHPDDLALATTVADIRRANAEGRIAILMGMEGGHMIDDDLRLLRTYARLGVRYLTLTHSGSHNWADAATGMPSNNGLTAFGREVVREMNRLGMMVDVSHASDKTFEDAIAVSQAPVIASHSSCRAIASHVRNMTDDMMRTLAANGGVIMINYHATFLSEPFRVAAQGADVLARTREANRACGEDEACALIAADRLNRGLMEDGTLPAVTWEAIVEHIDHAAKVAGVDHVGLGSDFDGATMPIGMDDVSRLPRLTDALLARGYSEADVTKILGGNILRVMERVERIGESAGR
jgi:membrane dipeptidase